MTSKQELSIAIPASLVSDVPHLREKTLKIGMVGRAAAIFGISKIIVFRDLKSRDQQQEIDLVATILSYIETPQYLRRKLFEIRPELKYVGVLPPLRTPHHPLIKNVKNLVQGEYREGVVTSHTKRGTLVDIGVEQNALIRNKQIPLRSRITVKVNKTKQLEADVARSNEINKYWGYEVIRYNSTFGLLLKQHPFDLTIATSKHGKPFSNISKELAEGWKISRKILIAFGAPTRGLYEITKEENQQLEKLVDFVINTVPQQKVETIRTEEALFVALGMFNLIIAKD